MLSSCSRPPLSDLSAIVRLGIGMCGNWDALYSGIGNSQYAVSQLRLECHRADAVEQLARIRARLHEATHMRMKYASPYKPMHGSVLILVADLTLRYLRAQLQELEGARMGNTSSMGSCSLVGFCKVKYYLLVICGLVGLVYMAQWTPKAARSFGPGPRRIALADWTTVNWHMLSSKEMKALMQTAAAIDRNLPPNPKDNITSADSAKKQSAEQAQLSNSTSGRNSTAQLRPREFSFFRSQPHLANTRELLGAVASVHGHLQKGGVLDDVAWSVHRSMDRVDDFVGWRIHRALSNQRNNSSSNSSSFSCAVADHPKSPYPGCQVLVNER